MSWKAAIFATIKLILGIGYIILFLFSAMGYSWADYAIAISILIILIAWGWISLYRYEKRKIDGI